jgi:diaminohydroxyphosphoribosylaminopyrimidine deaminase / 5-amino-6-(5-phosphoribosylamino)uracil reductase
LYIATVNEVNPLMMQRAMQLAMNGLGKVSPNPLVGCVIEHKGKIIGEGWHQQYGEPHAEVNALREVKDESLLPESTLYVNLEPCSHYGKTPPCADLIIEKKVGRVVISNGDPNPKVAGRGIKKLREAGIEVIEDILFVEGQSLNRRFFTQMERNRPYIILKWAQTADGFIARPDGSSKWISNEISRSLVHKWRTEEDAVLVGTQTALLDNPRLTVREWQGRNPKRIVIDRNLRLPTDLHLFDQSVETLVYTLRDKPSTENCQFIKLPESFQIETILEDLLGRNIQSIIVEGGTATLNQFIAKGLWDEARVFTAGHLFKVGISGPQLPVHLIKDTMQIENDTLDFYVNSNEK